MESLNDLKPTLEWAITVMRIVNYHHLPPGGLNEMDVQATLWCTDCKRHHHGPLFANSHCRQFPLPCHLVPCNIPDTKHSPIPPLPHQSIAPLVRTTASFLDAPLLPPRVLRSGSICINGHCGGAKTLSAPATPTTQNYCVICLHWRIFLRSLRMASMCKLVSIPSSDASHNTTATRTGSAHWEQRTTGR